MLKTITRGRTIAVVAAAALATASLAACGGSSSSPGSTSTPADSSASAPASAGLTVSDAWVKAMPDIKTSQMTGIFGNLQNASGSPVTVVSATTSASEMTELHETVMKDGAMVMQKTDKGFRVEPGSTFELKPGGNHIMVMKMTKPINAGEEVTVTLTTDSGANVEFKAVAKPFTMGNEPYVTNGSAAPSGASASMAPSHS